MNLNHNDLKSFESLLESEISKLNEEMRGSNDIEDLECIISEIADFQITLTKVRKMLGR